MPISRTYHARAPTQKVLAREGLLRNRLKKVDTGSPRSTFDGFLDSVNRAYRLVVEAEAALTADPPTMTREEGRKVDVIAGNLLKRAASTLDLSQVPAAHREDAGLESALQLKEILDRMLLPPLDAIPSEDMVRASSASAIGSLTPADKPFRWAYPNTEFEIVEIAEGNRQGEFLFSAGTVSRVHEDYQAVRDLPYRAALGAATLEYLSPELSRGFYQQYIRTPGRLIPHASFLGSLVDGLPEWANGLRAEQTIWQWIGLSLSVLATAVVGFLLFHALAGLGRRLQSPRDRWFRILAPAILAMLVAWVVRFIDTELNLTGEVLNGVSAAGSATVAALWVWAAFRFWIAAAETVIASPRVRAVSMDANLLRISARILGFLVGGWIVIRTVRGLGADVLPLLAGLGVGGLAIALAAQRTFANFMGSLILYINRPVRVGDFCRYGTSAEDIGTVEEIGLLSTRVRSLERTLLTVPNADFCHPMVTPEPARVRFVELGEYSLDLEIFAYLCCQDLDTFLAIKEDILLRIVDIVNEAGTGFAFPSAVEYQAPDPGVNAERGGKAEAHVAQWRASGNLPFPEFDPAEREQLEDVLDYPPKGSPDHEAGAGSSEPQRKP